MAKYRTKKLREFFDKFTNEDWDKDDIDGVALPLSALLYSDSNLSYNLFECCDLVYPGRSAIEGTKENIYDILRKVDNKHFSNKIEDLIND